MSGSIVPNATFAQQTFAGHTFLLTTSAGACLAAVVGGSSPSALVLR